MQTPYRLLLAAFSLLALAACAGGGAASTSSGGGSTTSSGRGDAAYQGPAQTAPSTTGPAVPIAAGPRVIRNASLTVEVRNGHFDDTLTRLIDLAAREGGYVSGSDAVSDTSDRIRTGTITFAVPAENYEATIKELRGYGTVQAFHASSQDVSSQYVDLQSRLKNAEAQRDAMLALLQRATQISDIINIQNQVGQIEAQIEQLKGQIDYLDHATTYATVSVTLREAAVAAPRQDQLGLQGAVNTAVADFFFSVDFLVVAVGALAPYLLIGLAAFGAFTFWRRRRSYARG